MRSAVTASPAPRWRAGERRFDLSDRRHRRLVLQAAREQTVASVSRGLAHQLRNPLQAIVLASRAIVKGGNGDTAPKMADVVERETERLSRLLHQFNQLLAPPPVSHGPIHMSQVFDEAHALAMHCSFGGGTAVEYDVAPDLVPVSANPIDLRLALLGVVVNAKEALGGGEGTVRLSASPGEGGALIAVEDDGPGIPTEDLERVFEPFFTTKETAGVLGLGLTAARLMVEDTGGRVWAEQVGGGGGGARVAMSIPWYRSRPIA